MMSWVDLTEKQSITVQPPKNHTLLYETITFEINIMLHSERFEAVP